MSPVITIKRVFALILLLAFFMPLSQCTTYDPNNEEAAPIINIDYGYSNKQILSLDMAISIAAFSWPMFLQLLIAIRKALNISIWYKSLELVCCLGTAYMLFIINIFGKPLYGSYIAVIALGFYGLLTIFECYQILVVKKHNKKLNTDSGASAPPPVS